MSQLAIRLRRPLDLARTLARTRPARVAAPGVWRATRTPGGPGTERLWVEGDKLLVEAWGPGAEWLYDNVPALVGELDDDAGFEPRHPLLKELFRLHRGVRIPRTGAVLEAAVPAILEQKVIGHQARQAYRRLLLELGDAAPGPIPLRLPPAPATLAATPYWRFHRWGVEQRRAKVIANAARHASRLEEAVGMTPTDAQRRLTALPGIGPWTAAEIAVVALGDPDAVSVGDFHLPHLVSWALAGEPRGTDERMLELLEPYRGHRARVVQLLELAGITAPRRGPRLAFSRIADF
ncbi:MAG: DNA-3-methyladenine glycosylase 2 family protein [Candidatus Dormibacteraeota bacterium]|nr:DNA-3-methyladenine glycosylase 2 family protein [Candidatus Dormibacteraeota bacterium]